MGSNLKYYQQFKDTLESYRVSEASKEKLEGLELVLLLGPTSAGRNTVAAELLKTGEYYYIVSDTTREKRVNNGVPEQDGVEYWFRSEEEVLADLQSGKYLEAELIHEQQVSGISIRELLVARNMGKIAITDIDLEGTRSAMQAKPDTVAILLVPPSFSEWQRRIKERGNMSEVEYRRRMDTALKIFQAALKEEEFLYVINDDIKDTVRKVYDITKSRTADYIQQETGRSILKELLRETETLVKTLV